VDPNEKAMVEMFARAIEQKGGKALLVGGIVRDELMGLDSKDIDFEVFGLPIEQVKEVLTQFGNVKMVGQHFGVLNIQELDWDVALPRREKKSGEGHKGFDVVPDPTMTIEEAARRRDLTINALSKDPLTGQIIDPLGGAEDIQNGILRAADPATFGDDPLRALRVAQFAARFDFEVEPNTLEIVAAQPLEQLPGERIFAEFQKMLLKGKKPSKGIETIRQANLLRYFPEIEALQGVPQDPEHHPEGDVFIHTLMVLDEAARQRKGDPAFDLPLMFGALAHDFGKPDNTQRGDVSFWGVRQGDPYAIKQWEEAENEGHRLRSYGHEEGGEAPAREFMNRMKAPNALTAQVVSLVSNHLRPVLMPERAKGGGYRRLARKLAASNVSFELLVAISKADTLGRSTDQALRRDTTLQDTFMQEAHDYVLKFAPPGQKPIDDVVKGRDLIERGFEPGPDMGKFLQLTRHIEDETGLKDPNKIIDLATKFLEHLKDTDEGKLDCGDSHIRPGEECYDGKYDEMRKKGLTDSAQGPDLFRTDPDSQQPDWLLWNEYHWPHKDGEVSMHPGLSKVARSQSSVTAEPAREHKRSLEYQPRWFDTPTKWADRNTSPSKKGSRDGFGGSQPYTVDPLDPPIGPPKDEDHWTGVTPEPGIPGAGIPGTAGQPAEFPVTHPPANKLPGFFPWDEPPNQLLTDDDSHPSPMRASDKPGSDQPGKFVRYPGGGGLDRAPMIRPQGKPKPSGFLPVVNLPDPERNMFKANTTEEYIPGGKAAGVPDSNFDQHELELGIEEESSEHGPDEKIAKEVTKDHLMEDSQYYSRKARKGLDPEIPNKEKNQINVKPSESVEGSGVGQGPGHGITPGPRYKNRTGKGFDKSRENFDYDYTGKKEGFLSMDLPKTDISKSARTIEDYIDIETIFPKDFNPEWGPNKPEIGPTTKHRNERHVAPDPIKGDNDMLQKQVQPLIPNQKLAIAIDPNGDPGNRIILMSPLFPDVSPAIQALRSQRFEKHGAVVVDGPPMWLMGLEGVLQAIDRNTAHESTNQLFQKIVDLASEKGLTINYTQMPRP